MHMIRILLVVLGLSAFALAGVGQESQDEPESPPAAEGAPEGAPDDAVEDVFIPSEELQADEEVTFPVGI